MSFDLSLFSVFPNVEIEKAFDRVFSEANKKRCSGCVAFDRETSDLANRMVSMPRSVVVVENKRAQLGKFVNFCSFA